MTPPVLQKYSSLLVDGFIFRTAFIDPLSKSCSFPTGVGASNKSITCIFGSRNSSHRYSSTIFSNNSLFSILPFKYAIISRRCMKTAFIAGVFRVYTSILRSIGDAEERRPSIISRTHPTRVAQKSRAVVFSSSEIVTVSSTTNGPSGRTISIGSGLYLSRLRGYCATRNAIGI